MIRLMTYTAKQMIQKRTNLSGKKEMVANTAIYGKIKKKVQLELNIGVIAKSVMMKKTNIRGVIAAVHYLSFLVSSEVTDNQHCEINSTGKRLSFACFFNVLLSHSQVNQSLSFHSVRLYLPFFH